MGWFSVARGRGRGVGMAAVATLAALTAACSVDAPTSGAPVSTPPLPVPSTTAESTFWWLSVTTTRRGCSLPGALLFAEDSATLSSAGEAALVRLAPRLAASTGPIIVAGYTDSTGSAAHGLQLSRARARAVAAALTAAGVPRQRLHVEGHGEADPVADNRTASGRAQNRRVEVRFTVTGPVPATGSGMRCAD